MSPYGLGETKSVEAIEHLIYFLKNGTPNIKRLAASGISKLSEYYKDECKKAIPYLIANLQMPYPQTRQYTLKALSLLSLDSNQRNQISLEYKNEDKQYNILLYKRILNNLKENEAEDMTNKEELLTSRKTALKREFDLLLVENRVKRNELEIATNNLIKTELLKLVEINSENNFPFKNSNLVSFLKGNKWESIEKYMDQFPGFGSLKYFERKDINLIFNSAVNTEIEIFLSGKNQYAQLTNLGKKFINSSGSTATVVAKVNNSRYTTVDIKKTGIVTRKPEYICDLSMIREFSFEKYMDQRENVEVLVVFRFLKLLYKLIIELMENGKLDERDASVFIKRVNGRHYKLKTLKAVSQEFDVTTERIRQIINMFRRKMIGESINNYIINTDYKELIDTLSVDGSTIDHSKFITFIDQLTDYFSIEKTIMITFSIFNIKNKNSLVKWMIDDFYKQKRSYRN